MDLTTQTLEHQLSSLSLDSLNRRAEGELKRIAPFVAASRTEYRRFGPAWWWIKSRLKGTAAARGTWIRGRSTDTELAETLSGMADLTPRADVPLELKLIVAGLEFYQADLFTDSEPPTFTVMELPDGVVRVYELKDPDATEQLDLFDAPQTPARRVAGYFTEPANFSATPWFHRAEKMESAGQIAAARTALRYGIERAATNDDRATGWLRLGQLYQRSGHPAAAVTCYQCAYDRDRATWIQGLMGQAFLDAGKAHEAVRCFERALEAMPGNPEYQAGLETARANLARHARGAEYYQLSATKGA